ncbi:hypothetical protein CRYUN_Cryun03dG0022100 [Craigia yunnanensis]
MGLPVLTKRRIVYGWMAGYRVEVGQIDRYIVTASRRRRFDLRSQIIMSKYLLRQCHGDVAQMALVSTLFHLTSVHFPRRRRPFATRPGFNPSVHHVATGAALLHQIMLISRLSRVGFCIAKELSRGGYTYMSRTRYRQWPCGQYQRSLLELLPETRAFQEAIFQKHHDFSTSASNNNTSEGVEEQKGMISVTFVSKDGKEIPIRVPIGMSMLEAAHENDIELEGACEGSLACSTCHVIVMDMECYNKLEDPTDEENDMLDLAFGLTETSRLGCQIIASPELDGIRLAIPAATRNFAVDGYVAKPH